MTENILFRGLYFTKSFVSVGKSLPNCYGCSYCRANDGNIVDYSSIIPSEINPEFSKIPVAVNLFYGDPTLQWNDTLNILHRLEDSEHTGPVIVITKGSLKNLKSDKFSKLDLHFGLSTFGEDSQYDGGSLKTLQENIEVLDRENIKKSLEFRPIIRDVNDSDEVFYRVAEIASKNNMAIGYCGLQVGESLRKYMLKNNIEFKPYLGHEFGLKKFISVERDSRLREIAKEVGAVVFRKTSCLLAYTHNLDRDPNAHYYRPNEVGCFECPLKEKCFKAKTELGKISIRIPFNYTITEEKNHICSLFKKGICKFPSNDCKNISGKFIKIDEELTTTDVRLIKWLTGFTVDANFIESPFMSDNWLNPKSL